jgi:hypothetical protein
MTRLVTYAHRPKRAPRKKAQAAVITGPAIVTAKSRQPQATIVTTKKRGRPGDVPDMTPEEYQRRGEAADALFRELVRLATGKQ